MLNKILLQIMLGMETIYNRSCVNFLHFSCNYCQSASISWVLGRPFPRRTTFISFSIGGEIILYMSTLGFQGLSENTRLIVLSCPPVNEETIRANTR